MELKNYKLVLTVKDSLNYGVLVNPPIFGKVCLFLTIKKKTFKAQISFENFKPKVGIIDQWIDLKDV